MRAAIEAAVRAEEETGAFRAMVTEAVRRKLPAKSDGEAASIAGEAVAAVRTFVELSLIHISEPTRPY